MIKASAAKQRAFFKARGFEPGIYKTDRRGLAARENVIGASIIGQLVDVRDGTIILGFGVAS